MKYRHVERRGRWETFTDNAPAEIKLKEPFWLLTRSQCSVINLAHVGEPFVAPPSRWRSFASLLQSICGIAPGGAIPSFLPSVGYLGVPSIFDHVKFNSLWLLRLPQNGSFGELLRELIIDMFLLTTRNIYFSLNGHPPRCPYFWFPFCPTIKISQM